MQTSNIHTKTGKVVIVDFVYGSGGVLRPNPLLVISPKTRRLEDYGQN